MDKIKRKIYLDKIIEVMKNDFPLFKNMRDYGFYDQLSIQEMNYVFSGVFEQPVKVEVYCYYIWVKYEYDENGNIIYSEDSYGRWSKKKYDENGEIIYKEVSNGNIIYYKDSNGVIVDNK
jgi:hypothetical protein